MTGTLADLHSRVFVRLLPFLVGHSHLSHSSQLDWGLQISQIKLLSVLGSKQGLEKVAAAYPGLQIYTCAVDEVVSRVARLLYRLGDLF